MDPYLHPIAERGYESDTGERDVPTLADFEKNAPVTVALGSVKRGSGKVLNRKGRAIIRIMAKHGWSHKAIAYIFRISDSSVSRAVENIRYNPRDNIDEDPERAGPNFCGVLPPPLSDDLLKVLKASDDAPKPNPSLPLDVLDDEWDTDELKYPDEEFSSNGRLQVRESIFFIVCVLITDGTARVGGINRNGVPPIYITSGLITRLFAC
ncbi:hypothetical protein B0H14DRAFT_2599834 [Mycena olivaceomarginata]|nr:hypothetical protein B0H14DRAFT_2599834 [Mycena olivaceomarginata]